MKFEPETEIGFGFKYKEQTIYIDKDDVVDYYIDDERVTINGNLICIDVMITE